MNLWEYIEEVSLMLLLALSAFCSAAETAYSAAEKKSQLTPHCAKYIHNWQNYVRFSDCIYAVDGLYYPHL